jgi:hypothetical protein
VNPQCAIYLLNKSGIDALCIIQDDEQDKIREIKSMHNTYRNAVFTLAVDGASSIQDGFLTSRSEFAPKFVSIAYNNEKDGKTRSGRFTLRHTLAERRGLSALDKRGWSLQENMLSPRTLHFGKQQVFWDCQTICFSEGNPTGKYDRMVVDSKNLKLFLLDRSKDPIPFDYFGFEKPRREWVLNRWHDIISDYGARRLSNDEDVFPGIAAIAEEVADQLRLSYKAGIWQEDIHRGLLWRVSERPELSGSYRAPSWTWASVAPAAADARSNLEYYVLFKGDLRFQLLSPPLRAGSAEIMEVYIETVDGGLSTFAQPLPSSYLYLQASCSPVQEWCMRSDLNFNKDPHEDIMEIMDFGRDNEESQRHPLRGQIIIDLDVTQHRSLFSHPESNIWFLLIADTAGSMFEINKDGLCKDTILWCLVLQAHDLDEECRYVRIGAARMIRAKDLPEPEWEERLVKIY